MISLRNWTQTLYKLNWLLYYEILITFSILTYGILILQNSVGSTHSFMEQDLVLIDMGFILFFIGEYLIRLYLSPNKWKFIKTNWFDLVAMIPLDTFFRMARIMRIIRVIHLFRRSFILSTFFRSKEIKLSLIIVSLIVLWGATGFYFVEHQINENITSYFDAIWWAIVTTTTVGYGDISPLTIGGRMIAIVLMLTGIGLIGSVTASVASHFIESIEDEKEPAQKENPVQQELIQFIHQQVNKLPHMTEEEYRSLVSVMEAIRTPASTRRTQS